MNVTFDIDESVLRRLRDEAERRGTTISVLVEAGLRHVLTAREPTSGVEATLPPLPTWRSGGFRVDIADRDALSRIDEDT
ncbi:MAG: hypothetical protein F4W89_07085 [Acidobacteria bacterium]|nr:hypothetical protein [Acidobacteriota bacterium]